MASTMNRMVFVTGFARGGTSWLRDCIGSHPDVAVLPRERVVFRDLKDPQAIRRYFETETAELPAEAHFIVNKAPANAPYIGFAAQSFPESKFIFIIRDPRDVLVSHQRGTQDWMKGANSTVDGCMKKIETYFRGWLGAKDLNNVLLIRYEDLHQDFFVTMETVFRFIGAKTTPDTLQKNYQANNFQAQTKRSNVEDRAAARRKGVIGEWAVNLSESDKDWYKRSKFFVNFMKDQSYHWKLNTYENIIQAMREANVNFLTEDDLHQFRFEPGRVNVTIQHDIDHLNEEWCIRSVRRTAEIDAKYGVASAFNLLPVDDRRYQPDGQKNVKELVQCIRSRAVKSYIGLRVNVYEKFYSPDAPEVTEDDFSLRQEVEAYLEQVIDDYRKIGISFRTAKAHGYGIGNKIPNNRGTSLVAERLSNHGIALFDVVLSPKIKNHVSMSAAITDMGGTLKPIMLTSRFELTDPRLYTSLPPGTFMRFVTHPGNYPVDEPSTVVMRSFKEATADTAVDNE